MAYDILVGRDKEETDRLGNKGLVLLGKSYVKMGRETSLVNPLWIDIAKPHTVLICGKRGSGKSYSLAVLAEGIMDLADEIKDNLSIIILDTMGIFWTMKYENKMDEKLLKKWGYTPKSFDINLFTPKSFFQKFKSDGVPVDYEFGLRPSLLSINDWCDTFNIKVNSEEGALISRSLESLKGNYDINEIMYEVDSDELSTHEVKNIVMGMFRAANNWGLFDKEAKNIEEVAGKGEVNVIDLSVYTDWSVKALVVGLLSKKLLRSRIAYRKKEELEKVESGQSLFYNEEKASEMPMVWMFIDEAHQFLGKDIKNAATDPLISLLREGRQPGISLVLATQQPGKIHDDVVTQSDIVLCHRVTAKQDVDALNSMMQSYMEKGLTDELNSLPREKGAGVILDDTSERIHAFRVRPRFSWHGGGSPSAVASKKLEISQE